MKTRYVIPMATALTLHALLLFGFNRPRSTPHSHPAANPVVPMDHLMPVDLRDPEELPDPAAAESSKGSPDAGRPVTDDRSLRPTGSDFPQAPEIFRDIPKLHPTKIAPGVFGAVNGTAGGWDPTGVGPIDFTKLDRVPRVLARVSPLYPAEARRDGRTGEVLVAFIVDEGGYVHNPEVLRSSNPIFEDATLRAVAHWRFEPGKVNGRPVRFRMVIPVRFNLDS